MSSNAFESRRSSTPKNLTGTANENENSRSKQLSPPALAVVADSVWHDENGVFPVGFEPDKNDFVIFSRNNNVKHNGRFGNTKFLRIVASKLFEYSSSQSRIEKSVIVTTVIDDALEFLKGFVRLNKKDGNRWVLVDEEVVRDYCTSLLRTADKPKANGVAKYVKEIAEEIRKNNQQMQIVGTDIGNAVEASERSREAIAAAALKEMAGPIVNSFQNDDSETLPNNDNTTKKWLTVCCVQPSLREGNQTPFASVKHVISLMNAAKSRNRHIDLFVLPELAPIGYSEETFHTYTDPGKEHILKETETAMAKQAHLMKSFVCCGTIGKTRENEPTIRQIVFNRDGKQVASYDKQFLCNYGVCNESKFFKAGTKETVYFDIDGFRFGIIICADMRSPDLCRKLARDERVDAILQPAAFARDASFRTWKSFRETRAVENSVYFLGVNYAGKNFGESSFNPPWIDEHNEPAVLGSNPGFLIANIERSFLDRVRCSMPFYKNMMK